MEDVTLKLGKLKSYVDRCEKMLCEDAEKLYKKYPYGDEEMYAEGFRGQSEEDYQFLVWMLHDIQEILSGVDAAIQEGTKLPPAQSDNPAMLSNLVSRLIPLLLKHGDMVVQVGGNDLAAVRSVIWTEEEQAREGGELRNCLFMEACNG